MPAAGCPGKHAFFCQFFYGEQQENPGTLAGRPLFVPPGVQEFSYICVCLFSPEKNWAAANGGVTNGDLRGVWPPFLEIGQILPFSPFFCLFRPFPEGAKSTWEIQKTEEKGLFPQISSDLLKSPSLKPPFAALQKKESCGRYASECPRHDLGGESQGHLGRPNLILRKIRARCYFACSPETVLWIFFVRICLGISHWRNGGDFCFLFFSGLRLHETKHEKSWKKLGDLVRPFTLMQYAA